MGSDTDWTVLVLTCQHKDNVQVFQRELEIRQRRGVLPADTVILTVEDPQAHVGSGGATLNALLVAAEHLSSRAGYTVVSSDVLQGARLLILHAGRDFLFDDCGRGFIALPLEDPQMEVESVTCNIDSLLTTLRHQLCPESPPGVWICSTDMTLTLHAKPRIDWMEFRGARVISLPGTPEYARNHGVYLANEKGIVRDIVYRGSTEQITACLLDDQHVPLVSGIVFLSTETAERFLNTLAVAPLTGCTYQGLDSGAEPLEVSLFLDILMSMCHNVTEEMFLSGSQHLSHKLRNARAVLWQELHDLPLSMVYIPDGSYEYLSMRGRDHIANLVKSAPAGGIHSKIVHSSVMHPELVEDGSCVINSRLCGEISVSQGSVIQNCHLQGPLCIGSGCLLNGIDHMASSKLQGHHLKDIILQAHPIRVQSLLLTVYSLLGADDHLELPAEGGSPTFLNMPWNKFFQNTGICESDLWGHECSSEKSVLTAQLFPVLHPSQTLGMEDVLWFLTPRDQNTQHQLQLWRSSWRMSWQQIRQHRDQERTLQARREIFFRQAQDKVERILLGREERSLMPIIRAAVLEGTHNKLLETLDTGLEEACEKWKKRSDWWQWATAPLFLHTVASTTEDAGVAARALACVADLLGCMAGTKEGLRSGPAANKAWAPAYLLLEKGNVKQGVKLLAEERERWLNRPAMLIRAARHYEGAEQILIRRAVMSSFTFVSIGVKKLPPQGRWVTAECPARIDMSGGWSDTPPITYEHGGTVVNVAVLVDGQRPIGSQARRIPEPLLRLYSKSGPLRAEIHTELTCGSLNDLQDYCQPQAPGALLKAAFICSGTVDLTCKKSLSEQLTERYGGGFELRTWSNLPHGSGLGTSSILAGAVMAVLYEASGRSVDAESLIHAVLYLEQVLTTGGGWQDQVGGLIPAVKVGRSAPELPLHVTVERLQLPDGFMETLNQHLLLVYTGKTRLARNLLQDVLRNWYARLPDILQNVDALVNNAELCAESFRRGDMQLLGRCLSTYWQQKKCMAPGCEPLAVRRIMDTLEPHVYGQSLAGAGGGGYLYILTKEPNQKDFLQSLLERTQGLERCSIHTVQVETETFTIRLDSDGGV